MASSFSLGLSNLKLFNFCNRYSAIIIILAALLRSQDLQLVLLSLESLGQLGHPGAGAAIRPMLEHHSDEVRAVAEWSMEQVSGLRHGDRLDLWDEWLASEASRGKPEPATPPTK